jgi:hypothetical protein
VAIGDAEGQLTAVLAGHGIAQLPTWLVKRQLEEGTLAEVLPHLATDGLPDQRDLAEKPPGAAEGQRFATGADRRFDTGGTGLMGFAQTDRRRAAGDQLGTVGDSVDRCRDVSENVTIVIFTVFQISSQLNGK